MKKLFLFCTLLAGIAVMTGCQKDQDVVTLKAVIDQDTKAYLGGSGSNTPYWDGDDQVFVKGQSFAHFFGLTSPHTTFATITNVPVSSVYCAIYPGCATLESMGDPSTSGTTAKLYYPPTQEYIWDETAQRQRIDMPMGAVTEDETLIFKNLCSILRVTVTNSIANVAAFDVVRLSVISNNGSHLSGFGDITLYPDRDPLVSLYTQHINVDQAIALHDPLHGSMGTISHSQPKTFDIVVPPFNCQSLTFDVEMKRTDGTHLGYYTKTVTGYPSVGRNEIATITLSINQALTNNHAYLVDGETFNSRIRQLNGIDGVTQIFFGNPVGDLPTNTENETNYVNLEAINSPMPVYGYIDATDRTVLHINTNAEELYANPNCSKMFQNLTHVINIQYHLTFITEDVTNMSYMYAGCTSLTTLPDIAVYNTTNVLTMAHMFDGCTSLGQLDLSTFTTHQLQGNGMVYMFNGCETLRTLIISSFTTEQITDMTNLFNGCKLMRNLHIDRFVISNNAVLTNMCTNLNSSNTMYNQCAIHCTDNVRTTLLSQDANNHYITGIDPIKVYFPNQGETQYQDPQ